MKNLEQDYYKIKAISASQLKDYADSPYKFWKRTVFNPNRKEQEDTTALTFGDLTHTLLLEPTEFKNKFAVSPYDSFRTKEAKEWKEKQTKKVIKQAEDNRAIYMIKKLKEHKFANALLEGALTEKEYFHLDEKTGLKLKCKVDIIKKIDSIKKIVIADYKTCADIEKAVRYNHYSPQNYHIQDSFYKKVVWAVLKDKFPDYEIEMYFLLQEKTEGNEDKVGIFKYNKIVCENMQDVIDKYLAEIRERLEKWESGDLSVWERYPQTTSDDIIEFNVNDKFMGDLLLDTE